MATTNVTDSSFQADVLDADRPVLVDFWEEWCGPCKALSPTLEAIGDELGDRVSIVKAKLDEAGESAQKSGVRTIPLLVLFKDGREVNRWERGNAPRSVIQNWLEGALADASASAA